MPRRKVEPVEVESPEIEPVEAPPPEPSDWSDLIGEVEGGDDAELHIYAEPATGQGGAAWCFACAPEDYPRFADLLARIRDDEACGPGRYSLRLKRGGRWAGSKRITIAGKPKPNPSSVTAPAAPANDEFKSFLQTMVVTLMGREAPQAQGSSISDVLTAAKMMVRERDPMNELRQMLELQKLMQGDREPMDAGGGGDHWLAAAINTFGPALVKATEAPAPQPAQAIAPPRTRTTTPPPAAPRPNPQPAAKAEPAPQVSANDAQAQMAMMLAMLTRGAENDSDPASYAEVLLDLLGADYAPALVNNPGALDWLASQDARVNEHRAWFGELIDAARQLLEGGDDDESAGEGGDLTGSETAPDVPKGDKPSPATLAE